MKIGVISDTHIPITSKKIPADVYRYFKGMDIILHAGDLVDMSVLDQLATCAPRIEAVHGNMDSTETMSKLPPKKIIHAGKFLIGLTHGWGPPQTIIGRVGKEFKKVDAIVFGHSHNPVNEVRNGILFFNPGSPTDTVFARNRTIGILEITDHIKGRIIILE